MGKVESFGSIFPVVKPLCRYKSKGRPISVPTDEVREWHASLISKLKEHASRINPDIFSMSDAPMVGKRSPALELVTQHRGNRFVYQLDIHHAFASVEPDMLEEVLRVFGCVWHGGWSEKEHEIKSGMQISDLVHNLCIDSENGGLYQGFPASPILFAYYAMYWLDADLLTFARVHRLVITRYVDDITVSSPQPITRAMRRAIRSIVEGAYFQISSRKSCITDLLKQPVHIHGIGLRHDGTLFLSKKKLKSLEGLLHKALIHPGSVARDVVHGSVSEFRTVYRTVFYRDMSQNARRVQDLYLEWLNPWWRNL